MLDSNAFGVWSFIAKRAFKAVFERASSEEAAESISRSLREREVALYIHIPFCTGTCLFCPYVRYPVARSEVERVLEKYTSALLKEIELYSRIIDWSEVKVVDIHAGGGTPSLLPGRLWRVILEHLAQFFGAEPRIAIEANPEDLRDEARAFDLVDSGVSEVSLGVQSFNPKTLRALGRRHKPEDSIKAVENLRKAGCSYINIDLMFMAPGQSLEEWVSDLETAASLDVDEVTCYPTLIAEHTIGYKLAREGRIRVEQPGSRVFKSMVYACEDILGSKGFKPVEIYGYSRREGWKYATVNYEMEGPLIALGSGAVGFTGGYEYHNTCSVQDYIQAVSSGRLPVAVARHVSLIERAVRYTVTRVFICRRMSKLEFKEKFNRDFNELIGRTGFGRALRVLKLLGYIEEDSRELKLTRRGLFTAHKICWAFVLNIPCRMAGECLKTPWPHKIIVP